MILTGCVSDRVANPALPDSLPSAPALEVLDIDQEFRSIASASCGKAYEIGVTEQIVGSTTRSVLVPETYLYNDFFAAVISDEGGQEPIWTPEDFVACLDFVNYSMAEEVGAEYEILVSGDAENGLFRTEQIFDEFGTLVMDYVVKDGVFVEVTVSSPDSSTQVLVVYGTPTETDIVYFREAIDLWLVEE